MNKQEIFDTVVRHLGIQGRPAIVGDSCKYRTSNGLKCAVGCLIPDELYTVEMEGSSVVRLTTYSEFNIPSWMKDQQDILEELQSVHDIDFRNGGASALVAGLICIATDHELDTSVIQEAFPECL